MQWIDFVLLHNTYWSMYPIDASLPDTYEDVKYTLWRQILIATLPRLLDTYLAQIILAVIMVLRPRAEKNHI